MMNKREGILWVLSVVSLVLDTITTVVLVKKPSISEGNPIMAHMFELYGALPTMVVTKLAALVVAVGLFYIAPDERRRWLVPAALVSVTMIAVVNNTTYIL